MWTQCCNGIDASQFAHLGLAIRVCLSARTCYVSFWKINYFILSVYSPWEINNYGLFLTLWHISSVNNFSCRPTWPLSSIFVWNIFGASSSTKACSLGCTTVNAANWTTKHLTGSTSVWLLGRRSPSARRGCWDMPSTRI